MLKIRIKASQITNLTDARYFAAWGVSWLGFDLNIGSESFIEPIKVLAMKEWIEGPSIVGEFGLQSVEEIKSAVDMLNLDYIQLNMLTDEAILKQLESNQIIKEIVIEHADASDEIEFHINKYAALVKLFLIDFAKNGIVYSDLSNETKNYLSELCQNHQIILSIDIATNQIDELLDTIQPYGLNVKGGDEEKVGFKSFDELDELFEAVEILE